MGNLHIMDHPLIQHKLSILRDKNTGVKEFREVISEISMLMCYEATRRLPVKPVTVETPLGEAKGMMIDGGQIAVVPILRAGLGMMEGMISLMPTVKIGHIGLYRDPDTLQPVEYYCKMPEDISEREVLILDPMLATGGSILAAVQFIKNYGCKSIKIVCVLAAPEGLEKLREQYPDIDVYTCALDERLDKDGFIIPGLGDAGDRIFGTK